MPRFRERARPLPWARAALQVLPMAALPAIASAPPSRSTAVAPRAARARRALLARPLLPARPLPPARVAAATWNLRRAGPPAAAFRRRPADGGSHLSQRGG